MTTVQMIERAASMRTEAAMLSCESRNCALLAIADELEVGIPVILKANAADIGAARDKISPVMLDRLRLTEDRVRAMAQGVRAVAGLPDPVGEELSICVRPDGLTIKKVSVPLGVVAIIYESRPNVTSDAAALCLKSGNVCILRTGREAHASAAAIVAAMRRGLKSAGLSEDLINFVEDTSREGANELMAARGYVDLLIPRGGAGLINSCLQNAKVPVIETGTGICHIYVDEAADIPMALSIVENAKCSRPSVCNAAEVCLVHSAIASKFLPELYSVLVESRAENKVELRLDGRAYAVLGGRPCCVRAGEGDFDREFLDYILAVKVVDDMGEAVSHIAAHSTRHSDCIVTRDAKAAAAFAAMVDSAAVYVNASTRFTDGGEFGLGCEMGISTQKLHARGPMGLRELTSYKYIVTGQGNIR